MNKTDLFVFISKPGFLVAILIMVGLPACMPGSVSSGPVISTSTVAPTDSRVVSTRTLLPTLTPAPTMTVLPLPDDKRIIASIDVGKAPWTMAVANGLLWVTAEDTVVRINPQTNQVVGKPIRVTVPKNSGLEAIAVGEDSVWVSLVSWGNVPVGSAIDSLIRLDPQTGETMETIKVQRGPVSMAYTPGFVWTVNWTAHLVSKIDTQTNEIVGDPFWTGRGPYSMTVGDESLWVINHDSGTLSRVDPETNQILADITLPWEPHRVAFGEDAVWVGNWHDLSVTRVDPRTNQVVGEPIYVGYATGNIAAGYGKVWVTSDYRGVSAFPEPYPDHTVLIRIDPKTNEVVDTIPLGGHPVDVKVTQGAVWVSIQNPNFVLKIQP